MVTLFLPPVGVPTMPFKLNVTWLGWLASVTPQPQGESK